MGETIAEYTNQSLFFIGHSLGGIYALSLAEMFANRVRGGITISTPYGGSEQADFAKYFLPFNKLMKDIGTMSAPMQDSRKIASPPNWTQIVTTVGQSPWIKEPNDGVVTLQSMLYRDDFDIIEVPFNHYEVVLSSQVVNIILDKIQQVL